MAAGQDGRVDTTALREELDVVQTRFADSKRELRKVAEALRLSARETMRADVVELYTESLQALGINDMTHLDLVTVARTLRMRTIPNADSFWRAIVERRRKEQLGNVPEKRLGINKERDEAFARRVGVTTVRTLHQGPFSTTPRTSSPTVLKPVKSSGSRGAFYVSDKYLFSIADSRTVADWDELEQLARKQLRIKDLDDVKWQSQELVTLHEKPAPDLKFYCFYGEIGAVLEAHRYPSPRYAYFDGLLRPINFRVDAKSGFSDMSETSISKGDIDDRKVDIARRLSQEIPAPFMRIDFLGADEDLVFCEFSSAPGMSHLLMPEHDRRLGILYHEAELRLIDDLLAGKQFDHYMEHSGRTRAS